MIHKFNTWWMLCCAIVMCTLALTSGAMAQGNAQPGVAPNGLPVFGFGIDSTLSGIQADLIANRPNLGTFAKSSDWVRLASDTSQQGVTGGIGLLDPVTGNPIDKSTDPSTVDTSLIVQVIHLRDAVIGMNSVPCEERFVQGSKFNDNPNTWSWDRGTPPNKNDMENIGIAFTKDSSNNLWITVSGDRLATNGTSYI